MFRWGDMQSLMLQLLNRRIALFFQPTAFAQFEDIAQLAAGLPSGQHDKQSKTRHHSQSLAFEDLQTTKTSATSLQED